MLVAKEDGRQGAGSKLLGLELVRFICAFAVLIWHYNHFYQIGGAPKFEQSAAPLHAPLAIFYEYGLFGVQLFWGISGFIFFMKYGSAIADGLVGAGRFFWLRFSRLYPLHFVTLLIVASLQPLHVLLTGDSFVFHDNGVGNFMAQLAMATHWGALVPYSFNGPIWSVSAEVLVYALFFLLMRWLGAGLLTLIVAFLASLVAQGLGKGTPVLFCACFFFAGAIAARLFLGAQSIGQSGRLSIAAATLLAVGFWLWGDGVNAGTMPLFLLGAMPLILLVAAHDWPIPQRWHGAIQAAGNLTYSSYLCHFPLQLLVAIACAAAGLAPPVQSPIFLIAYLAAVLLLSRWVFQRFERPTQAWIRQLAFRRQAIAA